MSKENEFHSSNDNEEPLGHINEYGEFEAVIEERRAYDAQSDILSETTISVSDNAKGINISISEDLMRPDGSMGMSGSGASFILNKQAALDLIVYLQGKINK